MDFLSNTSTSRCWGGGGGGGGGGGAVAINSYGLCTQHKLCVQVSNHLTIIL